MEAKLLKSLYLRRRMRVSDFELRNIFLNLMYIFLFRAAVIESEWEEGGWMWLLRAILG